MLIRVLLAAIALAALWGIHVKWHWIEVSVLVFSAIMIVGSIFVLYLRKVAIGTLAIVLAMVFAFSMSAVISRLGFNPVISQFAVVPTLLVFALVGASSASLYTYANYRVWHLLGSLVVFVVLLLLHFYAQSPRVQGIGLIFGFLASLPWLVGLAIAAAIRRWRSRNRDAPGATSGSRVSRGS